MITHHWYPFTYLPLLVLVVTAIFACLGLAFSPTPGVLRVPLNDMPHWNGLEDERSPISTTDSWFLLT